MCLCTSLGCCVTGVKLKWWDNYFCDSFFVSNVVCQEGILIPYLFSLCIDDLTYNLNTIEAGCYVGN